MSYHKSFSSIHENSGSALSSPVKLYGSPSRKKQVIPYTPRTPDRNTNFFFSPTYKVNKVNSPSSRFRYKQSPPRKNRTISNAEFTTMLENPYPQSFKDSFLGQALFDLSIGLRSLDNVLKQILNFRLNAPLKYYSYASLLSLINASSLCPPDAVLQLLSIGKVMITKHNYAKPQYLRALIKVTKYLISKNFYYVSYGKNMQDKPKRKLERLLQIFTGFLEIPQIGPEGKYGTSKIEDIMNKNRSFNEEKLEKEIQRRKRNKELKDNNNLLGNYSSEYDDKTEIVGSFSIESDIEDIILSDKNINSDSNVDKMSIYDAQNDVLNKKSETIHDSFKKNDNEAKAEQGILDIAKNDSIENDIMQNKNYTSNIKKEYQNQRKENNDIMQNENDIVINKPNNLNKNDNISPKTINRNDEIEIYDISKEIKFGKSTNGKDYSDNFEENDNNFLDKIENDDVINKNDKDSIKSESDHNQNIPEINDDNVKSIPDTYDKDNNLTDDDENIILLEDDNENSTEDDENLILGNDSENILTENDDDLILQNDDILKSSNDELSDKKSSKENYVDTKIQTDDIEKNNHFDLYHDEKSQTDESGISDDNFPISNSKNNNNEHRSNFDDIDKMSSKSWKSSLTESVQISIDIEPEIKNQNVEENIQLRQLEDSDPNIQSIERFIRSTDTLYERREKGKVRLENLSPEQREKINELVKLFNNWKTAYSSSRVVWNTMKADSAFDVNVLLSQIPVSYGDFLVEALTTFAEQEGIIIPKIESPL